MAEFLSLGLGITLLILFGPLALLLRRVGRSMWWSLSGFPLLALGAWSVELAVVAAFSVSLWVLALLRWPRALPPPTDLEA